MLRWLLSLIIIVAVSLQIIFFPWLAVFSNQAPLALIIILAISFIRSSLVIPLSVLAGLLLDLQGGHILGFWTLFYLVAGASLAWLLKQPRAKWWWRVVWLAVVLNLQFWYGQLPQFHWSGQAVISSLLLVLIISVITIGPCYWLRKRDVLS